MQGTAEDWENLCPKLLHDYLESTLSKYVPMMSWSEEDLVLEVGCGQGKATKNVLLPKCPKLKKIVAIDVNPDYIEYARKNYSHEKIEYKVQNITHRFVDAEKYDKIMCFYVFHLVPDFEKIFSNISTILKPGGYFLFVMHRYSLFSVLRELSEDEEWKKYNQVEDTLAAIPPFADWEDVEAELKTFLCKYDLLVKESRRESINVSFPNTNCLMDFLLTVFPQGFFEKVDQEVKHYLWKRVKPLYFKYGVREEENESVVPSEHLTLFGQKKSA